MAPSRFLVGSSMFASPLSQNPKLRKTQQFHRSNTSIRSQSVSPKSPDDDDEEIKPIKSHIDFLKLSVTLTVISASLSHSDALAAPAKKKKKRAKKPQELLTAEQLRVWSQGLPVVSDRIPYTEILSLKREGKLKHIIRPPGVDLQAFSEPVLVVLEDSRVFRTVLPSLVGNAKFWESWDEFKIESLCVNAYVPPVKKAELPRSYLDFLRSVKTPSFVAQLMPKKRKKRNKEPEELRKIKEELRLTKEREMEIARRQQEKVERAQKLEKMEEARRRKIQSRIKYEERMREAMVQSKRQSDMWRRLANDSTVSTGLGLVFFYLFYRIVVLGYKKQKKDYEDRLKIQQAEADERKKMKDLELKLQGRAPDSEEAEQGAGEKSAAERQAAKFLKSGARIRKGRNRKLPQYLDTGDGDVTFEDVAGLGKIRIELEEVVKFFTQAEVYRRRGVKIPGGILLCGSPGVGKTLLAKAVAGEAGVNFFSVSASQFVEIYVGVGAARIRALYEEAREHAPSIVFIDELDAVGRARGVIKGSGGRERDATLNQLLVCLDGFEGKGEVITIASTNRPDILDPALVRPGRFDRKILIPIPGRIGRIEILKVHARNKPMARDVDYEIVAELTDGMVGAELANIVEVAAASMMREGRTEIRTDDLLQAAQAEERGLLSKKDRTPKMWKQIAINEAAIAVVAANFPDLNNIEFISIAPRAGKELGYVRFKLDSTKFSKGLLSRQCLLDYITIQLAPRAADEIWYGEDQLSTIWAHTADNARSAARAFVLGGLSEKHHGITDFWVADRINAIDLDALKIVNSCHEHAKEILQQNQKLMDIVVDQLMDKKNLTRKEFFRLIDLHGAAKPAAPSIVELRNSRRLQFQEMAVANTDENEEPGPVSSNV